MSGCADPLLRAGSERNCCPTCGEYFASFSAFSRHRVGSFGVPIPNTRRYTPSQRRCLTREEMLARKMGENRSGYWVRALFSDEQKALNAERWAKEA